MLNLENLTIGYDDTTVFEQIHLQFRPGQISVLTGSSGCGKSSLIKLINGVIPHFQPADVSGSIHYDGQELLDLDIAERSHLMSTVFQNPKTQFYTVHSTDEMAFALENRNMAPQDIMQRIHHFTKLLKMEHLLDRDIFSLSGGEKQLLAITSVACMDNDIYLFDEPSSSLDREAIACLKKVLVTLKELGKIVIIAEHRLYYLKDIMDQLIVMKDKEAHTYDASELTQDFIHQNQLRQLQEITKEELMSACPYQLKSKQDRDLPSSAQLVCQDYHYAHKRTGRQAVFDFQLGLQAGITFIIGKNGIGKTTFLRCLSGLNKGFKGKTFYQEQPVKPSYDWISEVMQDVNYQLFTESVWSEISIVSDDDVVKKAALEQFHLLDKTERHPQSLSGGEKQRLLLAMAKASPKPIVILDEPTSGLCKEQMQRMIEDLQDMTRQGKLIIIVTHDYELIKNCQGHIVELID